MDDWNALLSWELGLAKSSLRINSLVAHASPKRRLSTDSLTEIEEGLGTSLPIRPLVCGVGIKPEDGRDLGTSPWKLSRSPSFSLGLGPESV